MNRAPRSRLQVYAPVAQSTFEHVGRRVTQSRLDIDDGSRSYASVSQQPVSNHISPVTTTAMPAVWPQPCTSTIGGAPAPCPRSDASAAIFVQVPSEFDVAGVSAPGRFQVGRKGASWGQAEEVRRRPQGKSLQLASSKSTMLTVLWESPTQCSSDTPFSMDIFTKVVCRPPRSPQRAHLGWRITSTKVPVRRPCRSLGLGTVRRHCENQGNQRF